MAGIPKAINAMCLRFILHPADIHACWKSGLVIRKLRQNRRANHSGMIVNASIGR
jgi:hypothetical protein